MAESEQHAEREPVTINDRRRIDPATGTVRTDFPAETGTSSEPAGSDEAPAGQSAPASEPADSDKVAELTEDLQRVQADFANFRKRTERDRAGVVAAAKASVYSLLLPVVDDLGRAREHGDLENSPLKPVADRLQQIFDEQGIVPFGEVGEPFDPQLHEAVQHTGDGDVSVVSAVYRQGYRHGERILRTAMVVVEDVPGEVSDQGAQEQPSEAGQQPEADEQQTGDQ
ncbi:GrpE protein [Segniliparus rotundus DSM 44985]|uniref:Protein GrpE n=1 Tax=Segniliparus rotundus (strain ATCC BAA-972 / CDC 1076 / CIP 108378 / DSM 44985 / JCM 13578) TaxID=640132 RepID=D6Z7H2_SEGRD|nr:nucleotide exchange factor GrpE [Segniliparus rotundus]ADG97902.1 GrpE protein [Segniliparus rotundus DSM 44985]